MFPGHTQDFKHHRGYRRGQTRFKARLGVEWLEDRTTPTVFPLGVGFQDADPGTVGTLDLRTMIWSHHDSKSGAGESTSFAYGALGWFPVVGDWDGVGGNTIGVVDPLTMTWYLRNSNTSGGPDITPFAYGGYGWIPVVGDWSGDQVSTAGVVDPFTMTWYLRDANSPGAPTITPFAFGVPGWIPVVGDWDGDGVTSVGVVDPVGSWYLRNDPSAGAPDLFVPIPAPNTQLGLYWNIMLQQAAIPTPGARVAFVGDSILYRFQHLWGAQVWQTQIAPLGAKNIAIDANTTSQVLWQIEQGLLDDVRPDVIVLMIGINNLINGQAPEYVALGVQATVQALQETQPQADILLLSVLPAYNAYFPIPGLNDQIALTNVLISNLHDGERVHYLDLTSAFRTPTGDAQVELMVDRVHPNLVGYFVLASSILPSIYSSLTRSTQLVQRFPLVGDWDGNGIEGIALVDGATGIWYVRNDFSVTEPAVPFQYGAPGWVPVAGDWDGDGDDDIGSFDPNLGRWYLRNDASPGPPDVIFDYGQPGWQPVTGDWDGDGRDSVGLLDNSTASWYLLNGQPGGGTEEMFESSEPGWLGVAGDWDNDGRDEVGMIDPTSMIWYLDTMNHQELSPAFRFGGTGWRVFAGDWDGDGKESPGVMDPRGIWYLRDFEREPFPYRPGR